MRTSPTVRPGAQRGVALIMVLLVISLATVAAAGMATRQQLDIRRTENVLHSAQAYRYLLGAEEWARHLLTRDARESRKDAPGEDWATVLPPLPVDGGQIAGRIEDLQARFNLNNLVQNGQPALPEVQRFERLLLALELDPALVWPVVDWIDPDENALIQGGAEDVYYLGLERPYRAANQPLASPSELLLIKGFTPEAYAKLAPLVCALPVPTALNVNTIAAEHFPLIMALDDDISESDAKSLLEARDPEGYDDIADFLRHPALAGRDVSPQGLSVGSSYFLLTARAVIGRLEATLYSVLVRDAQGATVVLARSEGGL